MIHIKLYAILNTCLLGLVAWALSGCSKDPQSGPGPGGDTGMFTISMEVPGTSEVKSKALTEADERHIQTIDLLLFREEGGVEKFVERFPVDNISNNEAVNVLRTFSVALPLDPANDYRIVLLANLRDEIDALDPDNGPSQFIVGAAKAEILKLITFELSTVGHSGIPPQYLPMYGETEHLTPILPTTSFPTVQLLRSVARFDFVQSEALAATGDVELTGLVIYNYRDEGYAAPDEGLYRPVYRTVSGPTPAGAVVTDPLKALEYTFTDPLELTREVYLTEQDGLPKIMVGAKFRGGAELWYNLSLSGLNTDFDQILRNHRYMVTIHSLNGDGYPSPGEAESSGTTVPADVVPWDEAYTNSELGGDNYTLDIDKRYFQFNADGRTGELGNVYADHKINITTDFPGGWQLVKMTDVNGVELTGDQMWAGLSQGIIEIEDVRKYPLSFTQDPDQWIVTALPNTEPEERVGHLIVRADKWEYTIRIKQAGYIHDCGTDGNYAVHTLNGVEYKTHLYVDNVMTNIARCWMTENLKAPTADYTRPYFTRYDDQPEGERGYYYHVDYADGICPKGWHVPNLFETLQLTMALQGNEPSVTLSEQEYNSLPAHYKSWYEGTEIGGASYLNNMEQEWMDWDQRLYLLYDRYVDPTRPDLFYSTFSTIISRGNNEVFLNCGYTIPGIENNVTEVYAPVRCVRDMPL